MSSEPEKDWLDEFLKTPTPYIEDDGFTAQVMAEVLRRKKRQARAAKRTLLIKSGLALLGPILAWLLMPPNTTLYTVGNNLTSWVASIHASLFLCLQTIMEIFHQLLFHDLISISHTAAMILITIAAVVFILLDDVDNVFSRGMRWR